MKQKATVCHIFHLGARLLAAFALMFAASASAADRNPCSEDIAKFCKDIKPGQNSLLECLEKHESQLSDACKDYETKMERPRAEAREVVNQQMRVRQACRTDIAKFCNDVKPGSDGVAACLKNHMSELSAPCGSALAATRGGQEERTAK